MVASLKIATRALFWLLIGTSLALVLLALRLSAGPIELGWLKPKIEQALAPERSPVVVSAERIELRLNKDDRTLDLVGVDVRYGPSRDDRRSAPAVLAFPEVELTLSVEALLKRGMIAASSVHAKAPSLVVAHDRDGVIDLRLEPKQDGDSDRVDIGALIRRFANPEAEHGRLAFLNSLHISGGRVAFYDHPRAAAFTADNADLTLTRRDDGVDGWLRVDILQGASVPASVQLSGRIEPGADRLPFALDVADLMPADLEAIWPLEDTELPPELLGVRAPVRATIKGEIGPEGALSPLEVDLVAGSGVVDLPEHLAEPLEIATAEFQGTVASDLSAFDIDHAAIVSRDALLSGSGEIVLRDDERMVALDLLARDVLAKDLDAFWPPALGVHARAWVVQNIEAGKMSEGKARLDLRPDDFGPGPLRDDAIEGNFAFEGLSVRYLDEMPPLEQAFGHSVFDARSMQFDVVGGTNAGVMLSDGSVTIDGMGRPGDYTTQLRVLADAEGSIEQILALLDHPPLEVAKELGIAPSDVAGKAITSLAVSLPLYREVTEEDALVLAEAELIDLSVERLPKLGDSVGLDQGAFSLALEEDKVRLTGRAEVNAVPLAIDITEPLGEGDAATRRIDLAGELGREQLERLGLSVDGIDGTFGFDATVSETETHFWVDLEADLETLALAPSGLNWTKPKGQEGLLRASVAIPIDGPIEVKQFDLKSGDLEAFGSLSLLPSHDGLSALNIERFRLADNDASIRITPDGEDGMDIVIEAERLDVDALFGEEREISDGFERFHLVLRADQLRNRGIELAEVTADAVHRESGWRTASVIGTLPSKGKIALELTPEGDAQQLMVRSENAGALIQAMDFGQRIDGGSLMLSARLTSQDPLTIVDGRFEIIDFVLQDAPLLARMLTLASLTGIGNLLGGEGIELEHLILPFTLNEQKLTFTDGLMRGSELGLTIKGDLDRQAQTIDLAGTIIPVYTLNRLIGRVPVIGRILTGVEGRGAFAATYRLEGQRNEPSVYVNPLSILTPGLLRDLVGGLINGTLEPPDVREEEN